MAGYIGSKASVVSSGAEHKKLFNITTTTTSLTGLVYTPTLVHVFHNGVRLVDGTDYTATTGTSITLTVAAENGDQVAVVSYATFQTSDTVSASAGGTFGNNVSVNGKLEVTHSSSTVPAGFFRNTSGGGDSPSLTVQGGANNAAPNFSVLDYNGTTDFVVQGTGNVGIGTSSPSGELDVTASKASAVTNLYVRNPDNTGGAAIRVQSQTDAHQAILGITDAGSGGRVGTLTNDYFYFVTNNTERLRINTSGYLIAPYGITLGTAVGTYAAANTLDDYEEGIWIPVVLGESATKAVGTGNFGYYTKIGNMVTLNGTVVWNGTESIGTYPRVGGFPFTSINSSDRRAGVVFGVNTGLTVNSGYQYISVAMDSNANFAWLIQQRDDTGAYAHTPTIKNSGALLGFSVSYMTAA